MAQGDCAERGLDVKGYRTDAIAIAVQGRAPTRCTDILATGYAS